MITRRSFLLRVAGVVVAGLTAGTGVARVRPRPKLKAVAIEGEVTARYLGLSTANPGDDASGLVEPSGNGYARVVMNFPAATNFPACTGSWGRISHFALFDAASGGNMLLYGTLHIPKDIVGGDSLSLTNVEIK